MTSTKLRIAGPLTFAALLLAGTSAHAQDAAPGPGVYVFDVTLAPVCLDGSFPMQVQTATNGVLGATLEATTSVRGAVTGTLSFGANVFTVKGKATSSAKGFKLALAARSGK